VDEAQRIWSANEGANSDRLADVSRTLAELELARGRSGPAVELIDAALARLDYPRDPRRNGLATALVCASRVYLKNGDPDKAVSFATAGLKISESIARDRRESADVGEALLVLAAARSAKGDRAGARTLIERSIEALSNGLGAEHSLTKEAERLRRAVAT
jgi:hypothetical protein